MIRLLVRVVAWLRDVTRHRKSWPLPGSPQEAWMHASGMGACAADGSSHYFGAGDRCQCGQWPSSYQAIYGARS